MSNRRLSPPEKAVWGQVARTVTPFAGKVAPDIVPMTESATRPFDCLAGAQDKRKPKGLTPGSSPKPEMTLAVVARPRASSGSNRSANTLDAGWDKRLAKGMASPDRVIDLHGETLGTAHARLDFALADAVLCGERLILLVTGKPARDNPRLPPTSRGVIRASISDWLSSSSHASKIAAVRNAHPRHGGAGALYVILRRARG